MPGLKGKLTITVHKARDLKDVQLLGKQDPYCQLMIGTEKMKTRIIKGGGKHPSWEQAFLFNLTGVEDAVHIKINDQEATIDRPIGRLDIDLHELCGKAANGAAWFQVLDVDNFSKMAGQLSLSIEFVGTGLVASNTAAPVKQASPVVTPTPAPVQQPAPIQQQAPPQQQYQQPPPQQYQQQPQYQPQPQYHPPQPQYAPQPIYQQAPVYVQQPAPVVFAPQPAVVYGQPIIQQPIMQPVQPIQVYGQPQPRYY